MAATLVQHKSAAIGAVNNFSLAFTNPVSIGNLVVVLIAISPFTASISSVTDNAVSPNSYASDNSGTNGTIGDTVAIDSAACNSNPASGNLAPKATFSGVITGGDFFIMEWSGVSVAAGRVDQTGSTTNTGTPTAESVSLSANSAAAGEAVVGITAAEGAVLSYAAGANTTLDDSDVSNGAASCHRTGNSAGGALETLNLTTGNGSGYLFLSVAYKLPSAGPIWTPTSQRARRYWVIPRRVRGAPAPMVASVVPVIQEPRSRRILVPVRRALSAAPPIPQAAAPAAPAIVFQAPARERALFVRRSRISSPPVPQAAAPAVPNLVFQQPSRVRMMVPRRARPTDIPGFVPPPVPIRVVRPQFVRLMVRRGRSAGPLAPSLILPPQPGPRRRFTWAPLRHPGAPAIVVAPSLPPAFLDFARRYPQARVVLLPRRSRVAEPPWGQAALPPPPLFLAWYQRYHFPLAALTRARSSLPVPVQVILPAWGEWWRHLLLRVP